MSDEQPIRPQRREIEIIKVLFDRNLSDRGVALAESRWPGSGEIVRLAYEWANLSPAERRKKLDKIGPAEIAKMRALASLNPDLNTAIEDLDRRGILPRLEKAAIAGTGAAASTTSTRPQKLREPDQAEIKRTGDAHSGATQAGPTERAQPTAARGNPEKAPAAASPQVYVEDDASGPDAATEGLDLEPLSVDVPDLDIGLPGTADFLHGEQERREQAIRSAETSMERVHERLNASANRITARTSLPRPTPPTFTTEITRQELPAVREIASLDDGERPSSAVDAPGWILEALKDQKAITARHSEEIPTDDELVAVANELGLPLTEIELGPGKIRDVYGGLVRRGSYIDVEAGPFPTALMSKNLVIVRGRIQRQLVERLNAGFADIPGTRATVKLHDAARVFIIPQ